MANGTLYEQETKDIFAWTLLDLQLADGKEESKQENKKENKEQSIKMKKKQKNIFMDHFIPLFTHPFIPLYTRHF